MTLRTRWTVLVGAVLLVAGPSAHAGQWTLSTAEDYQRGTLENVSVSSTGEISLSAELARHETGELVVWCSAADEKTGTVYFGTGTEGKIYALRAGEEPRELAKTGELVVTALSFGPQGKLYAATIPAGKIFVFDISQEKRGADEKVDEEKVEPEGKREAEKTLEPFATLPDPYIWSLTRVEDGLVAGTGPNGNIYRIDSEGKAELWFETRQSHVLSLATDPSGLLYAGTSPNGVLFRISSEAKGEVIFNTEEQEIRALVWGADALWIGANKAKKFDPKKFVRRLETAVAKAEEGEEKESPFQDLFDGSVYRMKGGGPPRLVHRLSKSYLTGLSVDRQGTVYVGCGDEGIVWRIQADGSWVLFAKLKESQTMTLPIVAGELAAIGTANPASMYRVSAAVAPTGSFTSEILDAKFPAIWGTLIWDATRPLTFQTRSGKTARVEDGTWSDWSEPLKASASKLPSPTGRYFQVRATWEKDPDARLRWIRLYYKTENQQPVVDTLEIEGFDSNEAFLGKSPESTELTIRWKATDPNGDNLVFRLYHQREGREGWVPLFPEGSAKKDYKWETRQAVDGWYRLKLVASDELNNPGDLALSAVKISGPILIDNRKPAFQNVTIKGQVVSGKVVDSSSVVARIDYSVNAGPWRYLLPIDGIYDERLERFQISLSEASSSANQDVSLRAFDAGGNIAVYQESFKTN